MNLSKTYLLSLCIIVSTSLNGCEMQNDNSDIDHFSRFKIACEEGLKKRLKSPSSFRMIKGTNVSELIEGTDDALTELRARWKVLYEKKSNGNLSQQEDLEFAQISLKRAQLERSKNVGESKPKLLALLVEYDSQNSFGALMRDIERCEYNAWDGEFSSYGDYDDVLINGLTYTDWLINNAHAIRQ